MSDQFVVDASILIQAFVQETGTARVQTLLAGLEQDEPDQLNVPEFCVLECTNILWKYVRLHGMPREQAEQAVQQLRSLPLTIYPATPLLNPALRIGLDQQIAIYDAVYLALADTLGHPLITADQRQAEIAEASGIPLKALTEFAEYPES